MKSLIPIIKIIAALFNLDWVAIAAFISVETGALGFDQKTGKIIIQFEPKWFKRLVPYAPSGKWSLNEIEIQVNEWLAFSDAFAKNPDGAMQATSIGLGQIMGFHWKTLGYKTVGAMWDDAKKGLDRQIWQICKFITMDIKLQSCLKAHDWDGVASIYNGAGYKKLALSIPREPYDISLAKAYAYILKTYK